jgi:hypothetical protein
MLEVTVKKILLNHLLTTQRLSKELIKSSDCDYNELIPTDIFFKISLHFLKAIKLPGC